MKKIITFIIILSLNLINCQVNNYKNTRNENKMVLEVQEVKKLINAEYDLIDSNEPSSNETIKWVHHLIYNSLKNSGYKFPLKHEFESKIKLIYKINTDKDIICNKFKKENHHIIIYGNGILNREDYRSIPNAELYPYDITKNIFLILKEHYYMSIILSPIDIITFTPDSFQYKVKIPQKIISRNKYLFNDDKSQLPWLINNDKEFMESLVKEFGYTEDEKLLSWVIENNIYNENTPIEYGKIFYYKDCKRYLQINTNSLLYLKKIINKDNYFTILNDMKSYLEYIFSSKENSLNLENKIKLAAELTYFIEQYKYIPDINYNFRMMGRLRYFAGKKERAILYENNYFNLSKFKDWWDNALYDEDFVTQCEYDGSCGRDNPEPDPSDPKYKSILKK